MWPRDVHYYHETLQKNGRAQLLHIYIVLKSMYPKTDVGYACNGIYDKVISFPCILNKTVPTYFQKLWYLSDEMQWIYR